MKGAGWPGGLPWLGLGMATGPLGVACAVNSPALFGTFGAGEEGGGPSNPAPTAGLTTTLPILLSYGRWGGLRA